MKDTFKNKRLSDEDMEKVTGGQDLYDNTVCQWNPNGKNHDFVRDDSGKNTCTWCGVYYYD